MRKISANQYVEHNLDFDNLLKTIFQKQHGDIYKSPQHTDTARWDADYSLSHETLLHITLQKARFSLTISRNEIEAVQYYLDEALEHFNPAPEIQDSLTRRVEDAAHSLDVPAGMEESEDGITMPATPKEWLNHPRAQRTFLEP